MKPPNKTFTGSITCTFANRLLNSLLYSGPFFLLFCITSLARYMKVSLRLSLAAQNRTAVRSLKHDWTNYEKSLYKIHQLHCKHYVQYMY